MSSKGKEDRTPCRLFPLVYWSLCLAQSREPIVDLAASREAEDGGGWADRVLRRRGGVHSMRSSRKCSQCSVPVMNLLAYLRGARWTGGGPGLLWYDGWAELV